MYKILIVEDDRITADNVCEQLLKWGYDVKIADDINVLIAKVQAMLRRTYSFAESTNIIEHNGCILNLNDQTFTYNGKRIELTKNEYRILQSLLENIGKVVSRDNIMMKLWESDDFIDDNTLTANRVYAMSAITALTAQNTTGVTDIMEVSPKFLAEQLDGIFTDIYPDAVKTGMVASGELIQVIADKLTEYKAGNIVVDPVMVATSGARLISEDAISILKSRLLPLATVITRTFHDRM